MKVDEGVRVSLTDVNISGTSVVPYVHWTNVSVRKANGWRKKRNGAYGKSHMVLDQPFLVLAVQRSMMCDLIQPLNAVENICIVPEISDVDRDLRGSCMQSVDTRPPDHITQFN